MAKAVNKLDNPKRDLPDKSDVFLQALENALGNVSVACANFGVSRTAFYNWMEQYPKFKDAVDSVNEKAIDLVESQLMKNIKGGQQVVEEVWRVGTNEEGEPVERLSQRIVKTLPPNNTAAIFYLKTKGRNRGYFEIKDDNQREAPEDQPLFPDES